MKTVSGYVCARNVLKYDYCAELAVKSLLLLCDEVVICDSNSDDGSTELFEGWAAEDPKVRVINYPFQNPRNDPKWVVKWMNWARERLNCEMQLYLDADEVLSDTQECHDTVKELVAAGQSGTFRRLNFWGDAQHTVPVGHVCGTMVARMGPAYLFMPADDWYRPEPPIRATSKHKPEMIIFHYGFLRKTDAFYAKSRAVQNAFFGSYDQRLVECEKKGSDWAKECAPWGKCDQYKGAHPVRAMEWLKERNAL